jgi:hypothetical protein
MKTQTANRWGVQWGRAVLTRFLVIAAAWVFLSTQVSADDILGQVLTKVAKSGQRMIVCISTKELAQTVHFYSKMAENGVFEKSDLTTQMKEFGVTVEGLKDGALYIYKSDNWLKTAKIDKTAVTDFFSLLVQVGEAGGGRIHVAPFGPCDIHLFSVDVKQAANSDALLALEAAMKLTKASYLRFDRSPGEGDAVYLVTLLTFP